MVLAVLRKLKFPLDVDNCLLLQLNSNSTSRGGAEEAEVSAQCGQLPLVAAELKFDLAPPTRELVDR
jgi:hypothetical protein